MLKLIKNEVLSGTIDGVNKTFVTSKIIGSVQSLVIDGSIVTGFTYEGITITLDVAPVASAISTYFGREIMDVNGSGEVTLGALLDGFYRKIGRVNIDGTVPSNIQRLYPSAYVKEQIVNSIKRICNISPEKNRVQQYSIKSITGAEIGYSNVMDNTISLSNSISMDIQGVFMIGEGTIYNYYATTDGLYQVADLDISKKGDRMIIGFKIPYGVKKIVDVKINSTTIQYVDEMDFTINTCNKYTIKRDFQGNDYIFLPYSEDTVVSVVKFIPDMSINNDEDIIDIPSEYGDLFIYDTAYRLLRDREDDRWQTFEQEVGTGRKSGLLFEYQSYIKSKVKRPRARVGFASTY